jgi:hypothetical protein
VHTKGAFGWRYAATVATSGIHGCREDFSMRSSTWVYQIPVRILRCAADPKCGPDVEISDSRSPANSMKKEPKCPQM